MAIIGTVQMILYQKVFIIETNPKNTNFQKKTSLKKTFLQGVWRQYDEQMILWGPWFWDGADGGKANNCAIVDLGEDEHAGKWATQPRTAAWFYICERDQ